MNRFFEKPSPGKPTSTSVESINGKHEDRDAKEMAALGKKQLLKRQFGFWSILGLGSTIMVTWEGMVIVFVYALQDGGPAGLVYTLLFTWLGYFCVCMSMGEMVSMAPTASGQYHWTWILAPPATRTFLSYVVGWQSIIAWQALNASAVYLTASLVQGIVLLNYPNYNAQLWQVTLLMYAVVLVCIIANTILVKLLPLLERVFLVLHICGFFAVLIPLVYLAPVKASAHEVFTDVLSLAGYNDRGLAIFVGLITPLFAFLGVDGAVHMCEEISNASTVVPNAMISGILLNGVLGFAMLVATLFCIGDINAALSSPYGFPIIEIFQQGVRSDVGATLLTVVITVASFFSCIAQLASASRVTWAFARDGGLPGSSILARVEPRSQLPLWSIALTVSITMLLALIEIGSAVAFNAVISVVVAGFLGSYIIPVWFLVYRRIFTPEHIHWGPWRLGRWGIPINIVALIWSIISMFFSFWPTAIPVDLQTMNWACLLWGGTVILSLVFYFAHGRKHYAGPIADAIVAEGLSSVIEPA